jgi:hippurate hydrolase
VKIADEYTPSVYNDPALVKKMVASMKKLLGDDNVVPKEPVMGGEDFSEYGRTPEKIPVAMLWLGAISPERVQESLRTGKSLPSLHSSEFAPLPEPTIITGVTAMTAAVLDLLGGK